MPISLSKLSCTLLMCWGLSLSPAQAATSELQNRIASLLAANNEGQSQPTFHITILTPETRLAKLCPEPDLRLIGHPARLTGNRSVAARCGNKQQFIQIKVNAIGKYWVVARPLTAGQVITAQDIRPMEGELANLPAGLLFDAEKIIGSTPTRTLHPGQPLAANQLRHRWAVLATQEVDITAPGEGFMIHARGKALNNGGLDDRVRVQMRNGQIVTAVVTGDERVSMNMDN
ncbi:flagellar basal body P-ring formation chaperone FlgA [Kosakonia sp. MUSA4]|uniref:flagellar basal body P-ring formation chaperone FlgA n=1 Tax=Kosakonia sp. MUSA4 TaxID=2067958 RepID=UPI00159AA4C5|nr:flagellar basal body P-ring formation chaperone FlgA [Kosakonia sp. MUSA4]QJT82128.1 flagella basal body P-ring formation protein FlgA [Kosakonia sp. MUSA4]